MTRQTAMEVVLENGGSLRTKDILLQVGQRLKFTEYELERFEKSGYIRWQSVLHFYSINAAKAGWLYKNDGTWYITPEGEESLKLSDLEFFQISRRKYREWKQGQLQVPFGGAAEPEEPEEPEEDLVSPQLTFEESEERAREEIERFILSRGPYEFQDMVASLLRAMGYYTPFVAPRGRDGGIDILAYRDPLGTDAPRIIVQIKHRKEKATVQQIRELAGLLQREGDNGLFVSTGGFTPEANNELSHSVRHIEKMDLESFIKFWTQYYDKMEEVDKARLPLRSIRFLALSE